MTVHAFQPAAPLASDGAALAQVLARAGVEKRTHICVTGPAALTAMLWLVRRGYDHAVLAASGAARLGEPADALLVPGACSPSELRRLLEAGAWLGDGGVLIAQVSGDRSDGSPDDVRLALTETGFVVQHHVHDKGRQVWIARRVGADFKKAA
jgi:hypothetical protein